MTTTTSNASSELVPARPLSAWLYPLLITVGFFIVLLFGILRHELWRDEAQAWLIGRDNSSLAGVFHQLASEGHPILWYACLWVLARITRNPVAMQLFHCALATISVALLAFRSQL